MNYDAIVGRLTAYRKKCSMRQNDMAQELKMTQSQYSKVEAGKIKISFDNLYVLQMRGYDVDSLILGEKKEELVPCLKELSKVEDNKKFVSLMKLCEWAWEQWEMDGGVPSGIGGDLLKIWVGVGGQDGTRWMRLRKAYNDISQINMANCIGVNIKKYRLLEQEDIGPDAELLLSIYEKTDCKPGFFMDERAYYLDLINEACKGNERREAQLESVLQVMDRFEQAD